MNAISRIGIFAMLFATGLPVMAQSEWPNRTIVIVLAIGAEKMYSPDKTLMFSAFDGAWDALA